MRHGNPRSHNAHLPAATRASERRSFLAPPERPTGSELEHIVQQLEELLAIGVQETKVA